MNEAIVTSLIETFGPIIASAVSAVIIWVLSELARQVRARTNNELAISAIDRLTHTVATTVMEIEQIVVPQMKRATADGKLNSRDIGLLRDLALKKVKERVKPVVQKQASRVINDMDGFLTAKIEQMVFSMKGECDGPNTNR